MISHTHQGRGRWTSWAEEIDTYMRLTGSEGSTYITGSLKYVYNTITGSTGKFTTGS